MLKQVLACVVTHVAMTQAGKSQATIVQDTEPKLLKAHRHDVECNGFWFINSVTTASISAMVISSSTTTTKICYGCCCV